MNRAYDGLRENSFNESYYEAFKNGSTGYPLIDACKISKNQWLD